MKYAEKMAAEFAESHGSAYCQIPWDDVRDEARALIKRVLEDAAKAAKECHCTKCGDAGNRVLALADRDVPETGTPGSQP